MSGIAKKKSCSIALYFYRLGNPGGGAERRVCQLANILSECGYDVILVTWDDPDAQTFYELDHAIKWKKLETA